jgi:beta-glucosidase
MNRSTGDAGPIAAPPARLPYRDPDLPVEARVADLLARMTPEEKVAQLGSIWAFDIVPDGRIDRERMDDRLAAGMGEITRLAGSTNLRAADVVRIGNAIQRHLIEETRLGIPAIMHEETLHGLASRDALCFQQSIGAAATWDPDVVKAMASTIRRRMLATGARHALAPVLDIGRDPRWGRIEETYGEDPYLAAALGVAYVRGIQGPTPADGVIATAKHLVGHGLAEGGRNQNPAHLGPRELRDEQLFPFEAAVRDAGIGSVMPAYGEVDGVPCHASRELLTTIIRDEWGFEGLVSSDYLGIEMISTQHRLTPDLGSAAVLALHAGVDQELPRLAAYGAPLLEAIASGRVDAVALDASVARVLRAKIQLGLFEQPYVALPPETILTALATDEQAVGDELARRSLVLVENDGVLPLSPGLRRLAVIGSCAASARDLLGDYSHLVHVATLLEMRTKDNSFGIVVHDDVATVDELAGRRTIVDAIRERVSRAEVRYVRGAGIQDGADADIAEAVDAARAAEVAVVILGERSGLTSDATTGEARDRLDLGFLGRQQELLEAVFATGTPVVLVVVSGRPLILEWASRHCAAVLLAWVPGDSGPDAIAAVLVGDHNPGGKLPMTFPRHVGQVPLTYRHHPSGGRSQWKGDYVDGPSSPLWPFGFGRSYTSFELSGLQIAGPRIDTDGGEVVLSVELANVGDRAGDEVVQLYARDEEASVGRPVVELIGFRRVSLAPGARSRITFRVGSEQFAYTGIDLRRIVEPGNVTLYVGTSSADLPLSASVELVGPVVEVVERHRYLTEISVGQG